MFVSRLQWFLVPVEKPCQRCEVLLVFCTLVIKSYWVGKCHRFLYLPLAAFYQRFISFDSLSDPGTFNQVKHEKRIEFSHFLSFKRGIPQSLPSFRDCCVGFPLPPPDRYEDLKSTLTLFSFHGKAVGVSCWCGHYCVIGRGRERRGTKPRPHRKRRSGPGPIGKLHRVEGEPPISCRCACSIF